MNQPKNTWSENVILVDCAYMDALLTDFTAHFSQAIGRPLGKADLCHWLDCLLLDAGVNQGGAQTFVAFIHQPKAQELACFQPARFKDLHEQAFQDQLGEFVMSCYPVVGLTTTSQFMIESVRAALEATDVRRLLVVADMENYGEELCQAVIDAQKVLADKAREEQQTYQPKSISLFTMRPSGRQITNAQEVILGYSAMSALGIRSDEL